MKMIRLGDNLSARGDASPRLLGYLSGGLFPLKGMAKKPYVRGGEILENFSARLHDPGFCYLIKKSHVLRFLSVISEKAAAEAREMYKKLVYLPIEIDTCEIIM